MVVAVGGPVQDVTHQFTECKNVESLWMWLRGRLTEFDRVFQGCSNFELLHLAFPSSQWDKEVVWLISNFVEYVYNDIINKKHYSNVDRFRGLIRLKLQENISSNGPGVSYLPFAVF